MSVADSTSTESEIKDALVESMKLFTVMLEPKSARMIEDILLADDLTSDEKNEIAKKLIKNKYAKIAFDDWSSEHLSTIPPTSGTKPIESKATANNDQKVNSIGKTAKNTVCTGSEELQYSNYGEMPMFAAKMLAGKQRKQIMEIEQRTSTTIDINWNHGENVRYRVGSNSTKNIEKCLSEIFAKVLSKQDKIEFLEPASVYEYVSSWTMDKLIDFQLRRKVAIKKQRMGNSKYIAIYAWADHERISAKHELYRAAGVPIPADEEIVEENDPPPSYMQATAVRRSNRGRQNRNSQDRGNGSRSQRSEPAAAPKEHQRPTQVFNLRETDHESGMGVNFEKFPECMNVLVLGETGVGKSTFINGLINYLLYSSMDEALKEGVNILIKSSFILTDDNYKQVVIQTEPTMGNEQSENSNEKLGQGQSSTQDPKSYLFGYSRNGVEKSIRIIDTPGIGDTRGAEQDKKNFEKILQFISQFSEIHAVCILIKPNTARLTLAFRFCIDELLVHLHRSASKNILFCFTNTRGTLYKPGDTLPTLEEHLSKLRHNRNIVIPLDKTTLFSFDNESFRFLCACKENFRYSDSDKVNFDGSWTKSVTESVRLFNRIADLSPHRVHDTLSLNNARNVILTLTRPLAEIAKLQMLNVKIIEDKMKEIEALIKDGKNLKGKLKMEQAVINVKPINYPKTVCVSRKCVEYQRFSSDPESEMKTVYKTVCHQQCQLVGVQVENCPNTMLQQCAAMGGQMNCQICHCLWSTHMHIRYELETTMEWVVDPVVNASIQNKDNSVATANLFLAEKKRKARELQTESDKITAYCAKFASFLAAHSILPYNDSYQQYIEHLIKEEENKCAVGGPGKLLHQMRDYKAKYEEEVRVLRKSLDMKTQSTVTADDIERMVKELQNLKNCGSMLSDVKLIELLSVQSGVSRGDSRIMLGHSWFGKVKDNVRKTFWDRSH